MYLVSLVLLLRTTERHWVAWQHHVLTQDSFNTTHVSYNDGSPAQCVNLKRWNQIIHTFYALQSHYHFQLLPITL